MKKFLLCLFAAMLIVPAFSGCGGSQDADIGEDTGEPVNDGMSDEDYEAQMNKGQEEHEGEE